MLKPELLPGISAKKGDDSKAIAGADYETAVIPPERRQHLSRFDATATHYDVPASHAITFATGS